MNLIEDTPLLILLRQNKLAISLFLISLLLLGGGLIVYVSQFHPLQKDEIIFDLSSSEQKVATTPEISSQSLIIVDVSGGVMGPGVYTLAITSRLQDAIIAAGGLSAEADTSQIAKRLNLASKLVDGQKIYIPQKGDEEAGVLDTTIPVGATKQININTASLSELDSLPGIGQTTAQKIVSNRPYKVITELQTKKIIGAKVFEGIKDSIHVE